MANSDHITPEEHKKLTDAFAKLINDDSVAPSEKKVKFDELLVKLGGDYKEKYDQFIAESKKIEEAMPTEDGKKVVQKLNGIWDDGTIFQSQEKVVALTQEITKDLGEEDKKVLEKLGKELGPKYRTAFKGVLPLTEE